MPKGKKSGKGTKPRKRYITVKINNKPEMRVLLKGIEDAPTYTVNIDGEEFGLRPDQQGLLMVLLSRRIALRVVDHGRAGLPKTTVQAVTDSDGYEWNAKVYDTKAGGLRYVGEDGKVRKVQLEGPPA